MDMVTTAMERGVHMWFFVSKTSHFLQPLDSIPNARYKQLVRQYCGDLLFATEYTSVDQRSALFANIYTAEQDALTPKVITEAFKKTGVYPFDGQLIQKLAAENIASTSTKEELQEHYVMVQAATKVCEGFKETAEQSERQVQSRKTWVEQQRTYNPSELIQLHSDQQEARRLQEAEKAERLNQRQERKRKREEDRLQR